MLQKTTPSSMAATWFKYNTWQLGYEEFSLAQWLWYWLLVHEVTGSNPVRTYISAVHFIHLFLCYGLVRKNHDMYMFVPLNSREVACKILNLIGFKSFKPFPKQQIIDSSKL